MVNLLAKRKGNQFELLVYKDLRDIGECKRTIGSGSSDEPGDILFKKSGRLFAIECKHLKIVRWRDLNHFFDKLNRQIESFGRGCPIIIYRQNREPIMVMCLMNCEGKKIRGITSYNIWKQLIR